MRRIQLILAALAIVVASFAAFSGPAMANDNWDNNWRWDNNNNNDNWWNNNNDNWWNNNRNDNWWWNNEVQNCPFWGDTSGIVNQWDCFD